MNSINGTAANISTEGQTRMIACETISLVESRDIAAMTSAGRPRAMISCPAPKLAEVQEQRSTALSARSAVSDSPAIRKNRQANANGTLVKTVTCVDTCSGQLELQPLLRLKLVANAQGYPLLQNRALIGQNDSP